MNKQDVITENDMKLVLRDLDDNIKAQVIESKLPILKQAEHINHLEKLLDVVKARVQELDELHKDTSSFILETFSVLKERQSQLEAIQKASQTLRKILKFLFLCNRLRSNYDYWKKTLSSKLSDSPFYIQLKSTSGELMNLINDPELIGIIIVENEMKGINSIIKEVQMKQ